jgi:hypothetical protein
MTGATNNYGFFGNIASGTNRWNLYMAGTAANYMAGKLSIGTTISNEALTIFKTDRPYLQICSSTTGTASSDGFFIGFGTAAGRVQIRNKEAQTIDIMTGDITRIEVKDTGQMRFVPLASDPLGAQSGDVYYNSTTNKLKVYNGTTWETITSL